MKKLFYYSILFFLVILIFLSLILSTIGIETNKFNELISEKVYQKKNIDIQLDEIKFKLDIKKNKFIFRNYRAKNKVL